MATTRKTHKSRRTQAPQKPVSGGPSASALAITPLSSPSPADLAKAGGKKQEDSPIGTGVPTEQPAEKQFWYRPAGGGTHLKFKKILIHRAAGHDDKEIAKKLKTTEQMVRQIVYLGKKNGWMSDDGEAVDIEAELAMNIDRKIVRNISASLDGGMTNWQTHEMTLAAAKGRGMFKSESAQGQAAPVMVPVAIQILMPTVGVSDQKIDEKNVGGVPAYLEGEVADGPERSGSGEGNPLLSGAPACAPGGEGVPVVSRG